MESTEGSKIFLKVNKAFTLQLGTGYLNHFLRGWLSIWAPTVATTRTLLNLFRKNPWNPRVLLLTRPPTGHCFSSSSSVPPPPNPQILGPSLFQVNPDFYPAFPKCTHTYQTICSNMSSGRGGEAITLVYEVTEKPFTNIWKHHYYSMFTSGPQLSN